MKTSVEWLQQYVDIPWEPRELASRLTAAGLEVEGIEAIGAIPAGVVTARILSREPHPNSDHLSVCQVTTDGEDRLQIVCGAPNCDAGAIVPLAMIGTDFGGGFHIKKAKLRGVESNGMLCSARELGLSEDHDGLMVLPETTPLGVPLADVIAADTVIDWEVTPNRPDWLSHLGIAREIAAVADSTLRLPEADIAVQPGTAIADFASVQVLDSELCPRYIARVFQNVTVGPSPDWMVRRLEAVGLRSVNNVVDITNYVMLEYGQPLHAFDLKTLAGQQIIVRRAENGEPITTLDGTKLKLTSEHLLIADRDRGVALAGIMGGENSMITDDTTTVLLEAAAFDRSNIRISSRTLGIATDSSYRFERGVSPETTALASARAAALLCLLCGATQVEGVIDCYGKPWVREDLICTVRRCNERLGITLTAAEIADCLRRRGLAVLGQDQDEVRVRTPEWRFDLHAEHDLIEEVAQMCGLDRIPEAPAVAKLGGRLADDKFLPQECARAELQSLGLDEIINYSWWSLPQCLLGTDLREEDILKVSNPISLDTAYLRPTLLPGLLQVVNHNISRNQHDLSLFETGRVFVRLPNGTYAERLQAAIAITGKRHPERFGAELAETVDFYDLKGILESWLDRRRLPAPAWQPLSSPAFKPGAAAVWENQGKPVITFGEAAPQLTKGIRLRAPLFIALIELQDILAMTPPPLKYAALPQFPATARDISFVAPAELTHQKVIDTITALKLPGLEKIDLFDIFADEKVLGKNRCSRAYSITFRNAEKTITDDEANSLQAKVRAAIGAIPGVELR
ncbi:MAG: phenylalanine--tRNA ligase subunit beta [Lentisphaeria bacterium]|nr:phenylalanine--tRNA ligase subunit beta [Lentisphaeria bacterium]